MKIIVSKNQKIGTADRKIYGHFIEHFHRQIYGGLFEPGSDLSDSDGFREDVLDALREIQIPILRWPGGCYVSAYDWKFGVGKERIPTFDKAWRVEEPNTFGTDEYIKLCRKLDCEPYICTNAGTGNAEGMSDWVEYCNLDHEGRFARARIENGYREPHAVKYWSIGNENWGDHEMGVKDSQEWGVLVRESAKMMHRVDPSIELSAASIPNLDWNIDLFRNAGKFLDWVSIHDYWDFPTDGIHHDSYEKVMGYTGERLTGSIDRVRSYMKALDLKHVKIAYDEWNLRAWFHPNIMNNVHRDGHYSKEEYLLPRDRNDDNSVYTMADAVFSAAFLNTCLKNCDVVGMACFSPVVNTRGGICTYKDGLVLRPTYYVFKLYANLLGDEILNSWSEEAQNLSLEGIPSDIKMVDYVMTMKDGKYVAAIVNKDPEKSQEISFRFLEDQPGFVTVHTLNGKSKDSYNDIGHKDAIIRTAEEAVFDGKICVEPHSVTVVEFR